eukprot:COSAG06_NODE_1719_length_8590_cov_18.960311_7_plen_193_part_00
MADDNETRLRDSAKKRRASVRWLVYQKEQRALQRAAAAERPPRIITLTTAYAQLAASRGWDVDPSKREEAMAAGYRARYGTTRASERPAVGAVADARAVGAVEDARAVGAVEDARAVGAVVDARAVGAVADARAVGAVEDARAVGAVEDARAVGAVEDARARSSDANFAPVHAVPNSESVCRYSITQVALLE